MKIREKIGTLLKIALPVIFITYAIFTNFFYHTHVVKGVTIVHSHPFSSDENGNPNHKHTDIELQLIHSLSSFHSTASIVFGFAIAFGWAWVATIAISRNTLLLQSSIRGILGLRAPPAC